MQIPEKVRIYILVDRGCLSPTVAPVGASSAESKDINLRFLPRSEAAPGLLLRLVTKEGSWFLFPQEHPAAVRERTKIKKSSAHHAQSFSLGDTQSLHSSTR